MQEPTRSYIDLAHESTEANEDRLRSAIEKARASQKLRRDRIAARDSRQLEKKI